MSPLPDLTRSEVLEHLGALLSRLDLPARVAIDGPDAAGKTTLADELAGLLGAAVTRIGADAFLRQPKSGIAAGANLPRATTRTRSTTRRSGLRSPTPRGS